MAARFFYSLMEKAGYMDLREGDEHMYRKGDTVLYGADGICDISDITTLDMSGIDKNRLYYVLHTRNSSGTIYVAADRQTSRMRKLISKDEAMDLISEMPEIEPLKIKDKKKPDPEYKKAIQKYDCRELISLIKCIYLRQKERSSEGKKTIAVDDKYMKMAENVLYGELGEVLDIPKEKVLEYLIRKIDSDKA